MRRQLTLIALALALAPSLGLAQIPDSNADLNGDVITNSLDFSILASCFGQDPASDASCTVADVDRDGDIDTDDFVFVAARFGQAYPWKLYPLPQFAVGGWPLSVALGDFNGDSVLDLAVANFNDDDVSVLLGNGDGSFQEQQRFAVGDNPSSVAVGDLNGDHVLDLAVVNGGYTSDDVSVLLGNGDGSFKEQQRVSAGDGNLRSLVLGDLNGDSVLDMVVAISDNRYEDRRDDGVSVLLGNGDGSFQDQQRLATGDPLDQLQSMALGDLNGDSLLDLVVSTAVYDDSDFYHPFFRDGHVSVLLGNGDGSFQEQRRVDVTGGSVALGDINGDSVLDLAVENLGSNGVTVLLGNGDGSFQDQQRLATGDPLDKLQSMALGDINGDSQLDLVGSTADYDSDFDFGTFFRDGHVAVLLGNGDGGFQAPQRFAVGIWPASVALGDFNGDKQLDVAVASKYFSDDVTVLLGDGDSILQHQQRLAAGDGPQSMAFGDVNGDSLLDLAVANQYSDDVSVFLSNGDGSFQEQQRFAAGDGPISVALGDINGDRVLDVVVANAGDFREERGDVSVLLGNGDGSFQPQQRFNAGERPWSVALGDVNGNSVLDLAITNAGSDDVSVLLGNGDGSFQEEQRFGTGELPLSVALGDLNGDNVLDMAVAILGSPYGGNDGSGVSVLLGKGDGSFQEQQYFSAGDRPLSVALGDFNGDNVLDLAVANYNSDDVSVLIGNGDGNFQEQKRFAAGDEPKSLALGDLNRDNVLDLAVANYNSDDVSVLIGNGDGSFQEQQRFAGGGQAVVLGDLNGDGMLDLSSAHSERDYSYVSVLLSNRDGR